MTRLLFIIGILCCSISTALSQHCADGRYGEVALFDSSQIFIQQNIQYGSATNYFTNQAVNLTMDIYYPHQAYDMVQSRPFVLMIHGGSFAGGNKNDVAYECMEFARRGFVAATITYRLGWNCDNVICFNCSGNNLKRAIYSAVQDARAALRFAVSQSNSWGIDPNWIFTGGESAGSITALLSATWSQDEADSWIPAGLSEQLGGLDNSGNTLTNTYDIKGVINHCGAVMNTSHLNDNPDVPIISFHDSNDCTVSYGYGNVLACLCDGYLGVAGSQAIHNYSLNNGHCSELNTVPQILPNHCSYPVPNLVKLASCFMKRIMCGFCMSSQTNDTNAQAICSNVYATNCNGTPGCTYQMATNYNPSATQDDGSCIFPSTCPEDINLDGVVGVQDLLQLIGAYGNTCD